jgi:hypothetical protein
VGGSADSDAARVTSVSDFLAHYGVKGMKWGVRRKSGAPSSSDAAAKAEVKAKAKSGGVKTLSNQELQAAINRMNLEQNFKRLTVNEKPAVTRFISSMLLEVGKRQVTEGVQRKVASTVAKKIAVKAATGGVG